MRHKNFAILLTATLIFSATFAVSAQQTPPDPGAASSSTGDQGQGRMRGGFGSFAGSGRGIVGTVTEAAADHYTIKTSTGDLYVVHFSANTRIMKQPAGGFRGRGRGAGQAANQGSADQPEAPRQPPQMLKATDIKVGDVITSGGEVDAAAKSVGAVFIMQLSPEQVQQMREMEANWGKTWLAGRITGIQDTTITIEGVADHQSHAVAVDENTSFRQRRDSITLADIKPGEELRAEGALKNGVFTATTVVATQPGSGPGQGQGQGQGQRSPRNRDGAASPQSAAPQPQ